MIKYLTTYNKSLFKKVVILGFPIIIANISRVSMELVDMTMINGLGIKHAFDGVAMGGMMIWLFVSLGIGMRTSTQTISSRRYGEKDFDKCGLALRHGLIIAFVIGLPLSILGFFFFGDVIPHLLTHGSIIPYTSIYVQYMSLGILVTLCVLVFQGFYNSIEMTKIHMQATIISNIINVYLNAGLIFGTDKINDFFSDSPFYMLKYLWAWTDFPALGVKGAALGTVFATSYMLLHYIFYLFKDDIKEHYKVFTAYISSIKLKKQLTLAYPLMLQEIFLNLAFVTFYLILENIGEKEFAATAIVFRIMHASFMPAVGIGQACATLVGKYLGEKNTEKAKLSIIEGVRAGVMIMGSVGLIFILFPYRILNLFNCPQEIYALSVPALQFIGAVQAFDAITIILWFSLSGAGDVKFPAYFEIFQWWGIIIPLSWYIGIYLGYGFWGPWICLGTAIIISSIVFSFRVKTGKWKTISV